MSTDDGTYASLLARIEDLEVRYAYLERLLGELDGVIRETADELARVGRVVTELRHRAEAEADQVQRRSAEEEKPPHY
ncbi:MAG: SlyX family protein [Pseudomonadota bacterium]